MITIDARGMDCPKPVILTKKELDQMDHGEVLTLADNEVCVKNLEKFARSQNYKFQYEERLDGDYEVIITKDGKKKEEGKGESLTIAFASDKMGEGEEELGKILMKSFIYTVSETKPLPKTLVFYNRGIYLTTEGSPVLDDLEKMKKEGVEIISCGTCLDFYHRKDQLKIGEISNMYDIYESIGNAGKNMIIR
ncbi:MAG: sulfurtransferase-like selenium metabolism protein YedF [Tissierellia bacterium]|nr:sulfurtransferase-like selenium metabolism protein YedF [Tissierellia bacterium]